MSTARMRVAGAPVSFGVDEIMVDDAWMPGPEDVLNWLVDIGVEGTELGPPGYLGDAAQLRQRLSSRGLELVGSFLPQHFSRDELAESDRARLAENLTRPRRSPDGSNPWRSFLTSPTNPTETAPADPAHPETWLARPLRGAHRQLTAAELCCRRALTSVHPHAGTTSRRRTRSPGDGSMDRRLGRA
jgi:inosose dehydratase